LRGHVLLFALAGCDASSESVVVRTLDPCTPISINARTASAEQIASVDRGIALWHHVGMIGLRHDSGTDIEVVFREAPDAFYGYYDDDAAIVYVNESLATEEAAVTIAHELGHAFGLAHVPAAKRASVMNTANVTITPTAADASEVVALWGDCSTR
jgi:hypothetical protein